MSSEIKKYLDAEGLKQVLQYINLQDYPNNDTLIAVINAIDNNKADKTQLDTNFIMHNNVLLNTLLETYLLNIDYEDLAFNTAEIIVNNSGTSSILGQAILGQLVLA